jgi:CSLREA domain-containing protein
MFQMPTTLLARGSKPPVTLSSPTSNAVPVIAQPHVAAETTILVTTTADELNNNGNCSLREAIRAANLDTSIDACPAGSTGTDTISLLSGTYTLSIPGTEEDASATGDLDITSDLTINGAGAETTILDGNHIDRVLHIIGNVSVKLSEITIINGQTEFAKDGGGIYNTRAELTIANTTVRDNKGQGYGGGISNSTNGTLNITSSSISNNESFFGGGGIYNEGNATIYDTNFNDNIGISAGGGVYNGEGVIALTRSLLTGNSGGGGGGIFANGGNVVLNDIAITRNRATSLGGGGIHTQSGTTATLNNVTISGNSAAGCCGGVGLGGPASSLNNVTITNNVAGVDDNYPYPTPGGGISTDFDIKISNTIIAGNTTLHGPGPDCAGALNSQGNNLIQNISGCTIAGDIIGNQLEVDPKLGPLQIISFQGGSSYTLVHPLLAGSPAIDAGNPTPSGSASNSCLATDQRGVPRPQDGNHDGTARCDIGAYERQPTDLSITSVSPVQVVEGADLVVNKLMAIHVVVKNSTSMSVSDVHLTLRYNNGTSQANTFYINEEENWDPQFRLNNATDHLNFSGSTPEERDVYFIVDDLKPKTVGQYPIEIILTWPDGQKTISRRFNVVSGWTSEQRLLFYPVDIETDDYRSHVPEALELVKALYPINPDLISRSPKRPKTYQSWSLPPLTLGLLDLVDNLTKEGHIIDPAANRFVGVTQKGFVRDRMCSIPGILCQEVYGVTYPSSPYTVLVESGHGLQLFTQEVAHELGHTWGHPDHNGVQPPAGEYRVYNGFWPSRRQRMHTGDRQGSLIHDVINIMCCASTNSPYQLDSWFPKVTYERFLNTRVSSTSLSLFTPTSGNNQYLLITGFIYANGQTTLTPWYRLPGSPPDPPSGHGDYSVELLNDLGAIVYRSEFDVSFNVGKQPVLVDAVPFGFSVPYFDSTAAVILRHNGSIIAQRSVTYHAPIVTITTPQPDRYLQLGNQIRWIGTDPDGDMLSYSVFLSDDKGNTWSPLATDISEDHLTISSLTPPGEYVVKLVATDNINTTTSISEPFKVLSNTYMPLVVR